MAKKQCKSSNWTFAFLGSQIANFPGKWTFAWCKMANFRETSRMELISQMPWINLFDSSKSRQSQLNWRSGRQLCRLHIRRGGHEKIWKFPDLTKIWWSRDCHWATWQDNCRCEERHWVRNYTELEWWPSWTIPAIFSYMPISPKCRNSQSRNNSVMHQSEMEVYQIFFHQSILRRLMKKWYIHHLSELSLC